MTEQDQAIAEMAQQYYEQEHIKAQITALHERATAASLNYIHFMDKDNPQTKKYLAALKIHVETTKEINRLKNMLNEKTN